MTLRYTLVDQLHYLGETEDRQTVVTIQRWDALRASARRSDLVILNDGVTVLSRRCVSTADLTYMDGVFAETVKLYGPHALAEEQARDLIGERTGTRPADTYCVNRWCPARVPLGASRCGCGHTYNQTGSGSGHGVPAGRDIVLARRGGA